MTSTCGICGRAVRSEVPSSWHPHKRARRAERDMQAHLDTHSFAEVLRFEIRQDLDEVPDEQRLSIVRDIYRSLLGTTTASGYALGQADGVGVYSVEEALGQLDVYRLWRHANACGFAGCQHGESGIAA